jgi:hypothetical protein
MFILASLPIFTSILIFREVLISGILSRNSSWYPDGWINDLDVYVIPMLYHRDDFIADLFKEKKEMKEMKEMNREKQINI